MRPIKARSRKVRRLCKRHRAVSIWSSPVRRVATDATITDKYAAAAGAHGGGAAGGRGAAAHPGALGDAALPGHAAYNKARGFSHEDGERLAEICDFFAAAAVPPVIEVWAGDASAALGQRLARAGFYAAEVNATLAANILMNHVK